MPRVTVLMYMYLYVCMYGMYGMYANLQKAKKAVPAYAKDDEE